jgi:DNA polymerase elongation subunit (family B)
MSDEPYRQLHGRVVTSQEVIPLITKVGQEDLIKRISTPIPNLPTLGDPDVKADDDIASIVKKGKPISFTGLYPCSHESKTLINYGNDRYGEANCIHFDIFGYAGTTPIMLRIVGWRPWFLCKVPSGYDHDQFYRDIYQEIEKTNLARTGKRPKIDFWLDFVELKEFHCFDFERKDKFLKIYTNNNSDCNVIRKLVKEHWWACWNRVEQIKDQISPATKYKHNLEKSLPRSFHCLRYDHNLSSLTNLCLAFMSRTSIPLTGHLTIKNYIQIDPLRLLINVPLAVEVTWSDIDPPLSIRVASSVVDNYLNNATCVSFDIETWLKKSIIRKMRDKSDEKDSTSHGVMDDVIVLADTYFDENDYILEEVDDHPISDPEVEGDCIMCIGAAWYRIGNTIPYLSICFLPDDHPCDSIPNCLVILCAEGEKGVLWMFFWSLQNIFWDLFVGFNNEDFDTIYCYKRAERYALSDAFLAAFTRYYRRLDNGTIIPNIEEGRRIFARFNANASFKVDGIIRTDLNRFESEQKTNTDVRLRMLKLQSKEFQEREALNSMLKYHKVINPETGQQMYKENLDIDDMYRLWKDNTPEGNARVALYCLVDAKAAYMLMAWKNIVLEAFETASLTRTTLNNAFHRADGMRVIQMLTYHCIQYGFAFADDNPTQDDRQLTPGYGEKIGGGDVRLIEALHHTFVTSLDFTAMYPSIKEGPNVGSSSKILPDVMRTIEDGLLLLAQGAKLETLECYQVHGLIPIEKTNRRDQFCSAENPDFEVRDRYVVKLAETGKEYIINQFWAEAKSATVVRKRKMISTANGDVEYTINEFVAMLRSWTETPEESSAPTMEIVTEPVSVEDMVPDRPRMQPIKEEIELPTLHFDYEKVENGRITHLTVEWKKKECVITREEDGKRFTLDSFYADAEWEAWRTYFVEAPRGLDGKVIEHYSIQNIILSMLRVKRNEAKAMMKKHYGTMKAIIKQLKDPNVPNRQELEQARDRAKVEGDTYNSKQLALKIAANSEYGAGASSMFAHVDRDVAATVTFCSRRLAETLRRILQTGSHLIPDLVADKVRPYSEKLKSIGTDLVPITPEPNQTWTDINGKPILDRAVVEERYMAVTGTPVKQWYMFVVPASNVVYQDTDSNYYYVQVIINMVKHITNLEDRFQTGMELLLLQNDMMAFLLPMMINLPPIGLGCDGSFVVSYNLPRMKHYIGIFITHDRYDADHPKAGKFIIPQLPVTFDDYETEHTKPGFMFSRYMESKSVKAKGMCLVRRDTQEYVKMGILKACQHTLSPYGINGILDESKKIIKDCIEGIPKEPKEHIVWYSRRQKFNPGRNNDVAFIVERLAREGREDLKPQPFESVQFVITKPKSESASVVDRRFAKGSIAPTTGKRQRMKLVKELDSGAELDVRTYAIRMATTLSTLITSEVLDRRIKIALQEGNREEEARLHNLQDLFTEYTNSGNKDGLKKIFVKIQKEVMVELLGPYYIIEGKTKEQKKEASDLIREFADYAVFDKAGAVRLRKVMNNIADTSTIVGDLYKYLSDGFMNSIRGTKGKKALERAKHEAFDQMSRLDYNMRADVFTAMIGNTKHEFLLYKQKLKELCDVFVINAVKCDERICASILEAKNRGERLQFSDLYRHFTDKLTDELRNVSIELKRVEDGARELFIRFMGLNSALMDWIKSDLGKRYTK